MKRIPVLLICFFFAGVLSGQRIKLSTSNGRKLINGADNRIIIASPPDSVKFKLSVLTGTLGEYSTNSMIYKNKRSINFTETGYKWNICTVNGFEPLIITYLKNDKATGTDTILFDVVEPPIFEANIYKTSTSDDIFDRSMYKDLTPTNIIGVDFWGTTFYDRTSKVFIADYTITIYSNDKIKAVLRNDGPTLTEQNKSVLAKYKTGYIRIDDINAMLECGVKIVVKPPKPVYYP